MTEDFRLVRTQTEELNIIIDNILKMVSNRKFLDKNGELQPVITFADAKKKIKDTGDNIYTLKISDTDTDQKPYAFKIFLEPIASSSKTSPLLDFLDKYTKYNKIVVAPEYNKKVKDAISKAKSQIFDTTTFFSDIITGYLHPEYQVLSPSEYNLLKENYNMDNNEILQMNKSDMIVKYFGLKSGDCIRVIRPSPTTGQAISYRAVK
jgi:DNA-directed RNA polymerase subunit H (RpoH/RPB5)